jgi:hypothetical protein
MFSWSRYHVTPWLALLLAVALTVGCGGNPYLAADISIQTGGGGSGGGTGGEDPGGGGGQGGLNQFINISMRNSTLTIVHYYLHLFAFMGPGATVNDDSLDVYESFGYIRTGSNTFSFGSVTVTAPAGQEVLWYWHERGSFPESSIGPEIAGVPTYDAFFDQLGALVPVPDLILFYEGTPAGSQCSLSSYRTTDVTGVFTLEAFDPLQVQGTGCNCLSLDDAFQSLAPATVSATSAQCNQYLRGSDILYDFRDADTSQPPAPERLLWQVSVGGNAYHDFAW